MFSRRTEWKLALNRFSQALAEAFSVRDDILDLTVSNPTRVGLKYDGSAILEALASGNALDYDPQAKGLMEARQAVVESYLDRGEHLDPESLVLTSGTSEGYSYVFRLLANPGDEVLVPKPSYPLFEFLAELQDVKLVPYPLIYDHGWQIDFHSLEQAVTSTTRAAVLVNPNNPTGSFVTIEEQARLNAICSARGLSLVVDEVFLDYELDGQRHQSFVRNLDALTFTLSGLSKISALPQMKLAWIAVSGPETLKGKALERLEIIADTYLSVGAPVQWAARTLLQQKKSVQAQLRDRIQNNLAELDRALRECPACSRLQVEGGWYAILRVPVTASDEDLAIRLLRERGVLVHPGHFYDFPSDGYLVIGLIADETSFRIGVERVLKGISGE
jgi:aspartate/methionine/tyrosine aminotransferase